MTTRIQERSERLSQLEDKVANLADSILSIKNSQQTTDERIEERFQEIKIMFSQSIKGKSITTEEFSVQNPVSHEIPGFQETAAYQKYFTGPMPAHNDTDSSGGRGRRQEPQWLPDFRAYSGRPELPPTARIGAAHRGAILIGASRTATDHLQGAFHGGDRRNYDKIRQGQQQFQRGQQQFHQENAVFQETVVYHEKEFAAEEISVQNPPGNAYNSIDFLGPAPVPNGTGSSGGDVHPSDAQWLRGPPPPAGRPDWAQLVRPAAMERGPWAFLKMAEVGSKHPGFFPAADRQFPEIFLRGQQQDCGWNGMPLVDKEEAPHINQEQLLLEFAESKNSSKIDGRNDTSSSTKATLSPALETAGYVDRKDVLIESLTVREFLYYSALLQLPGSCYQKKDLVEDAIFAMSLGDYADKLIGGHCFMKHLPCGERRRVSIARELVTRPHILFIDEPLYHLDSVSALLLMVTLKKLASTGCTLIFTMYQSSTEVFGLFDRICLLSNGNTLFFGETLACLQHFSNAGFPCPIMQSPSDHFLRAINTDFDRIIAMCKNLQDDNGDFSSVNMDTAVAIRTLEATYKLSANTAAVESMILRLTEKEGPHLKSKGRPSDVVRIIVLIWRSLLTMSREWKYFWIRFLLYMLLTLSIGTVFLNIGHTLSSVMVRVSAIFIFVSFMSLLSIAGLPAHIKEIKIFIHEESNQHSGATVFLLGHFLASIPFIFLISISSTLVFYFLCGLRNEFNPLMYFVLNIFMCLLANEGLIMVVSYIWFEVFSCLLTLLFLHVLMMLVAGYFRIRNDLPAPIWKYPLSYAAFHTYSVQGLLENEYIGSSFAVGEVRAISGLQAVRGSYEISASQNAKWINLLVLFVMAIGYRFLVFLLLRFRLRKKVLLCGKNII